MLLGGEAGEVVGAGLVHEAAAVLGNLHEGLRAGVELAHGAAEHAVLVIAAGHTGCDQAAVEHHGCSLDVHGSASPKACLDALAAVLGAVAAGGAGGDGHGGEGLHHLRVARVATGGQDNVGGIDLNVAVFGLKDCARYLAVSVHKLDEVVVPQEALGAGLVLNIRLQNLVAVVQALVLRVGREVHVLLGRHIAAGLVGRVDLRSHLDVKLACEVGCLHNRVEPVDELGAFVDPHLLKTLVALVGGVTGELILLALDVDEGAGLLGVLGVDGTDPVTRVVGRVEGIGHEEIDAQVGCGCGCGHAAVAGADNEKLALLGVGDVAVLRLFAQPCGVGGLGVCCLVGQGDAGSDGGYGGGAGGSGEEVAAGHSLLDHV